MESLFSYISLSANALFVSVFFLFVCFLLLFFFHISSLLSLGKQRFVSFPGYFLVQFYALPKRIDAKTDITELSYAIVFIYKGIKS